jgi:hypothetical protein
VRGYRAHKKPPLPGTLQLVYVLGPPVVLGGAISCERGTPALRNPLLHGPYIKARRHKRSVRSVISFHVKTAPSSVGVRSLLGPKTWTKGSPTRKRPPLGPYRKPMPRVLGGSQGGWRFRMRDVPLYASRHSPTVRASRGRCMSS